MLIINTKMMLNFNVISGNVAEIICLHKNKELNCVINNLTLLHLFIIQYLMCKTHLQLVPRSRKCGYIHALPHMPSWRNA
jgi:hypothetical protein